MSSRVGKFFVRFLGPLLGLLLFSAALWVLHRELAVYPYHEVIHHLARIPKLHLFIAMLFSFSSYLAMASYEGLGFRYLKHPLQFRKIALGSFLGNAYSRSLGFPLLTGSAVRYRLYSNWGLSALEIAGLIAFAGLTFWLGLLVVGGGIFLVVPLEIPGLFHIPIHTVRPIGVLFFLLIGGYLAGCCFSFRRVKIGARELALPPVTIAIPQIALSTWEWLAAGCTMYILLPSVPGLSPAAVLGFFLLAQIAGTVSHVPGGLGVYETVMILLLKPFLPANEVLSSLLAYRAVYYLTPLFLAAVLQGGYEIGERWFLL